MNIIDFLIAFVVILITARGMEIGFVRQASSLGGLVLGLFISSFIASQIGTPPAVSLIIVGVGVLAAIIASEYVGIKIKKTLNASSVNIFDRIFGAIAGTGIGLLLAWFSTGILPSLPSTSLQVGVRDSKIVNWLDATLPPTTSIIGWLEKSFEQTNIPTIVSELEHKAEENNTEIPDVSEFNSVINASRKSIVKIEGRSCSGVGVGSGFIASPNYIVTNAHVVAGMRHPYIQDENGRIKTQVVAFDPDNDVAVLKSERLEGTSLEVAGGKSSIGTEGVVLGYPGGRDFTSQPGVIIDRFTAIGKDIYGEKPTKRDVYSLKANIEPGNSGGPFIGSDGQVKGLIFARSTTNEKIGFALSTPIIKQLLNSAKNQPTAGESLRCVAK